MYQTENYGFNVVFTIIKTKKINPHLFKNIKLAQ